MPSFIVFILESTADATPVIAMAEKAREAILMTQSFSLFLDSIPQKLLQKK